MWLELWSEATPDELGKHDPESELVCKPVSVFTMLVILHTNIPCLIYKGELLDFDLVHHNHYSDNPWAYLCLNSDKNTEEAHNFQELKRWHFLSTKDILSFLKQSISQSVSQSIDFIIFYPVLFLSVCELCQATFCPKYFT